MFKNRNVIKNIQLEFYGGFGNNIQQIALGIMYCDKYKKNLIINNHKLINDFFYRKSIFPQTKFYPIYRGRFFYFGSLRDEITPIDYPLYKSDYDYYTNNFHITIKNKIKLHLNFLKEIKIDSKSLVIHIRKMEGHPDYVQNPVDFYKKLFELYEHIIVVTDDPYSPLLNKLKSLKKFDIQSSSVEEDFNLLASSKNLATSGVGTFSIAASMISNNLENIYYSNFFLDRHLNPEMLRDTISKHRFKVEGHLGYGNWNKNKNFLNEQLLKKINVKKIDNF